MGKKRTRSGGEEAGGSAMRASVSAYAKAAKKAAREVRTEERSRSKSRPAAAKAGKAKAGRQGKEEAARSSKRAKNADGKAAPAPRGRSRSRSAAEKPAAKKGGSKRKAAAKAAADEEEEEEGDAQQKGGASAALFFVDKVGNRSKKVRALQKESADERRRAKRKERKERQRAKKRDDDDDGSAEEQGQEEEAEEEERDAAMEGGKDAAIEEGARVGIDVPLPESLSGEKRRRVRKRLKKKMRRGGVRPAAAPAAGASEERRPEGPVSLDAVPFDPWAAAPAIKDRELAKVREIMEPARPQRDRAQMERLVVKRGYEVAAQGHSANPLPEDHQSVLREAHSFDERAKKELIDLNKKLNGTHERYKVTRSFPRGSDPAEVDAPARPPVRAEDRLTQAQRNKAERKRDTERMLDEKRRQKAMLKDAARATEVAADIDRELAEREAARAAAAAAYVPREPRLGKAVLTDRFPDAALSEDLRGSLRTVPKVDSVAAVQFRRLQERRLIEPRMPHKKYRKNGLRKSHKTYNAHKSVEFF